MMKTKKDKIAIFVLGGVIVCLLGFMFWGYNEYRTLSNLQRELNIEKGLVEKSLQAKTEKELLKKYSKVYFLNEHYIPEKLSEIPKGLLYEEGRIQHIHQSVLPFLEEMIKAAEAENISLEIISAYRSFGEQSSLKTSYKVVYGAGTANQFSADQGFSEHQLGTT